MNCKEGDLAYAVRGLYTRHDRPPVVEVVSFYAMHPEFGVIWLVRSREPLRFLSSDGEREGFNREVHAADDWLRPISGVPVLDEQLDEVPA
ncbi:hypothetical protein LMG24238_06922 [Paraburkholderia sediminicola]|uniref:DUF1653 domain-containing protein n=1 Tax=Paraburkholderia sediminicola TaxID=458836 RepID=A0A6J5CSE6_9BURK|nr:hypothetical protein [Paraburkholderia sediminicola]CAB3742676.1 hypothetical protein LMG24238_06922 [Paraburkholderia sediminicola]